MGTLGWGGWGWVEDSAGKGKREGAGKGRGFIWGEQGCMGTIMGVCQGYNEQVWVHFWRGEIWVGATYWNMQESSGIDERSIVVEVWRIFEEERVPRIWEYHLMAYTI